jgi:Ca-activated chloride channel family protein
MPDSPLNSTNGVDATQPNIPSQFGPPTPVVIGKAKGNFSNERNRVDVMLILDRSGSMNDSYDGVSKLEKAKEGLIEFAKLLSDTDNLGLTVFNGKEDVLTPVSQLGLKRQGISTLISKIDTSGNTLLYKTIADQVADLQAFAMKNIKAIVVLTDGVNDAGNLTISELINKITPSGNNEGEGIKVYTIAYGNPADINSQALTQIAVATGGQEYSGTPQSICQVYDDITQDISSNGTSSC